MDQKFIFRCKTHDAYIIKILLELLHNNIKTGCFVINRRGIFLCMTDSNRRTLINVELQAKEFNVYYLRPETLNIGMNLNHQYKMLKSVKKKDSLQLFIHEDAPTDLGIQIIPKDYNRLTTSYVRIQNIQNLEIQLPDSYKHSILISSAEFCKMCKDMLNISNTILVVANRFNVKFVCHLGSVYSREVLLGETVEEYSNQNKMSYVSHMAEMKNNNNPESSSSCSVYGQDGISLVHPSSAVPPPPTSTTNSPEDSYVFQDDFDTEQLSRILKISGLSNSININCTDRMPLLIQSKIGSLGEISIYIKSRRQIDEEQQQSNAANSV